MQQPCTCLIHAHKELGFPKRTDATSANATNIQDIRVIKARATAAGKDPGLPDPTRIIYLRHSVVLISALYGRDMWSSESRALCRSRTKSQKEAKRNRFKGRAKREDAESGLRGAEHRTEGAFSQVTCASFAAPLLNYQSVSAETDVEAWRRKPCRCQTGRLIQTGPLCDS